MRKSRREVTRKVVGLVAAVADRGLFGLSEHPESATPATAAPSAESARLRQFSLRKEDGPAALLSPPLHFGVAGPPPILLAFSASQCWATFPVVS